MVFLERTGIFADYSLRRSGNLCHTERKQTMRPDLSDQINGPEAMHACMGMIF